MRVLLLLLPLFVFADDIEWNIDGVCATGGSPMMKQWGFSYSLLKPNIATTFTPVSGDTTFQTLGSQCRNNYQADLLISDINFLIDKNTYGGSIQLVPFFASALVMAYNVPELVGLDRIILSRDLLYQIWMENVTMWNDKKIRDDNPTIADKLPNETIRLVYRTDKNGFTSSLTGLLQNVDLDRNKTNQPCLGFKQSYLFNPKGISGMGWRKNLTTGQNISTGVNGAFAMASRVLTTNYTLGYTPYVYADQAGLTFAKLRNRNGSLVEPGDANLAASFQQAEPQLNLTSSNNYANLTKLSNYLLADRDGPDTYPFTGVLYLGVQRIVDVDCDQRREVWKFLNWVLTSDAAAAQIKGTIGYSSFGPEANKKILKSISNYTCQNDLLLANNFAESSSTPLRQAVMSIAAILLTVVVIIAVTMGLKRNNRITKAAGLAFAFSFLIGCAFNYISVFIWALVPDTDRICQARYILVAMGYTLLLGAMFAKCWEIRKIFARARSGDISPIQELPWWKFCQAFFAVISVNFIFLLGVANADPPKSYIYQVNDIELIAVHVCGVLKLKVWAGLEFTYFGALVLWGGYLAYSTREIWEKYNYPNESKSILLSIYNLVFCLCIIIPLMTVLSSDLEVVFFFVATGIIFPTSFALFMVYGPKMILFLGSSFRGGGSQGATSKMMSQQAPSVKHIDALRAIRDTAGPKEDDSQKPKPTSQERDIRDEKEVIVEEDAGEMNDEHHPLTPRTPEQVKLVSPLSPSPTMGLTQTGEWRVLATPEDSGRNSGEVRFNFDKTSHHTDTPPSDEAHNKNE